ncbi:MAG: glycosyltransferase family 4 protein, partial [Nitrospirae bacterium]|nr:glycosyltransferase family 4 protein [Nitrospirota bacterium]
VITNVPGREFDDRRIINLNLRNSDALTSLLIPTPLIYKKIKKILSELKPDIVHVHNIHISLSTAAVLASRGFPLVLTVHDFYLFCPTLRFMHEDGKICGIDRCIYCMKKYYSSEIKKRWGAGRIFSGLLRFDMFCRLLYAIRRNQLKRIIPLVDKFICPNKSQKELLKTAGIPENKLTALPYTSDFKVKEIVLPEGKYLGYAGALIREKGVHVLLKALSLLPEDIKLLIAGDGIYKDELEKISENLGIKDRVRFVGRIGRDDMKSFYDKIHVLVVPSLWPEVLGIVGLEAMASGKPVIGSNIGGIPDWIEDGVNGFLVSPDSPDSLAEKARTLFNADGMIYKFGLNGQKKFVNEFSPGVHKNKIINLYRELLHGHNIN